MTEKLYRVVNQDGHPHATGDSWNKKPRTYSAVGTAKAIATNLNNKFGQIGGPYEPSYYWKVQEAEVEWHDVAE